VRGRAATVAAVVSLLLLALGVVVAASQRERHQLGSNFVRPVAFVADAKAGKRVCQAGMLVPAGTGGIGLRIGTFGRPGPAVRLSLSAPGASTVRGTLAAGWSQGDIVVPIPELGAERRDARICLEHDGPGVIAIAGGPGLGRGARVGRRAAIGMIRLEYVERNARPWWPVVPKMDDRLAAVRDALPGSASLPLYVLLALGVIGGSVALVLREGSR
jgi:hypothetical protein